MAIVVGCSPSSGCPGKRCKVVPLGGSCKGRGETTVVRMASSFVRMAIVGSWFHLCCGGAGSCCSLFWGVQLRCCGGMGGSDVGCSRKGDVGQVAGCVVLWGQSGAGGLWAVTIQQEHMPGGNAGCVCGEVFWGLLGAQVCLGCGVLWGCCWVCSPPPLCCEGMLLYYSQCL